MVDNQEHLHLNLLLPLQEGMESQEGGVDLPKVDPLNLQVVDLHSLLMVVELLNLQVVDPLNLQVVDLHSLLMVVDPPNLQVVDPLNLQVVDPLNLQVV